MAKSKGDYVAWSKAVGSIKYVMQYGATARASGHVPSAHEIDPLLVYACDVNNRAVAGLTGGTYRGLATVQRLWFLSVDDNVELSARLIESFEAQALLRSCQLCLVDLEDQMSEAFFLAAGYAEMPLYGVTPWKTSILLKRASDH